MAETLLRPWGELAASAATGALPPAVRTAALRAIRDTVGVALAGADAEPARIVTAVADGWGGTPDATALALGGRHPAATSALIGGTLAHTMDFDDTHLPSIVHPSASVVPAALAVAEAQGATGAELLAAVAVGDELCVRSAMTAYDEAARESVFFERGMHATAISGALGAAAAAAILYGLDADGARNAISIATSMGAGLIEANRTGGSVKRVHCGWAAHAGVAAAELARAGLTGAPTAFEGRFGWIQAYAGSRGNAEALVDGLGETWAMTGLHVKPYPCNHFTHAGIDAALALRADGVAPQDVVAVEIGAPPSVLRTIAEPAEAKAAPPSAYTARFSAPFTFATAMCGGGGLGVFLEDFTDKLLHEPVRRALATRVRCVPDSECAEIYPGEFPSRVRVTLAGGETRELFVAANRGGPGNPLSDEELRRKFAACAGRHLDDQRVADLSEALDGLEAAPDISDVVRLTTRSPS